MRSLNPLATRGVQRALALTASLLFATSALGAQVNTSGTLFAQWGDPPVPGVTGQLNWMLLADNGQVIALELSPELVQRAGGFAAIDRRRVSVVGQRLTTARTVPGDIPVVRASAVERTETAAFTSPQGALQIGSRPYAILLCKFNDIAAELGTAAQYQTLIAANTFPNMDHYFRELSNNQMNLSGTTVFGWFTLPQPKSYYVSGSSADLQKLAIDCTAAADPSVDFSAFVGVGTQFNSTLATDGGGLSWGGGAVVTVDGQQRVLPFVWMASWAAVGQGSRYGGWAHELGHSFGLPHSSGPYGETYDSRWDVMSNAYSLWSPALQAYTQQQTILFHKNLLGWVPPGQRYVAANPSSQTIILEKSEFPPASNYIMAHVPIPGSPDYYTVEARRLEGYDANLPAEAILIHRVSSNYARVVDPDNNQNPNDAGAIWVTGETFTDANGVSIFVGSRLATGWSITISVGSAATCTITTASAPAAAGATTGGGSVPCGSTVTLNAAPETGYYFVSWTEGGAVVSTSATFPFTAVGNRTLVANFALLPISVALSVTPANSGTTTGGGTYPYGTEVSVGATPATGFTFVRWTENGGTASTLPAFQLVASANRTLVANFDTAVYTIATSSQPENGGGTSGGGSAKHGGTVTVTAVPAPGFAFVNWTDGGSPVSTSASFQFNAAANRTLVANFQVVDLQLLANQLVAGLLNGTVTLPAVEMAHLDYQGNRNGSVDLGDLVALLDHNPSIIVSMTQLNAALTSSTVRVSRFPIPPVHKP